MTAAEWNFGFVFAKSAAWDIGIKKPGAPAGW
jgi:hypothetical protein